MNCYMTTERSVHARENVCTFSEAEHRQHRFSSLCTVETQHCQVVAQVGKGHAGDDGFGCICVRMDLQVQEFSVFSIGSCLFSLWVPEICVITVFWVPSENQRFTELKIDYISDAICKKQHVCPVIESSTVAGCGEGSMYA